MANSNCLRGMACPECGNEDWFCIEISAWSEVTDDGTGDIGDVEWDSTSGCRCPECHKEGIVADFMVAGGA